MKFHICCGDAMPYLNWTDCHINVNLPLTDFFQTCHQYTNVVKIFHWSTKFLWHVISECKYVFHLMTILGIAISSKTHYPFLTLGGERELQIVFNEKVDTTCDKFILENWQTTSRLIKWHFVLHPLNKSNPRFSRSNCWAVSLPFARRRETNF